MHHPPPPPARSTRHTPPLAHQWHSQGLGRARPWQRRSPPSPRAAGRPESRISIRTWNTVPFTYLSANRLLCATADRRTFLKSNSCSSGWPSVPAPGGLENASTLVLDATVPVFVTLTRWWASVRPALLASSCARGPPSVSRKRSTSWRRWVAQERESARSTLLPIQFNSKEVKLKPKPNLSAAHCQHSLVPHTTRTVRQSDSWRT